jgi:hypothetical protein
MSFLAATHNECTYHLNGLWYYGNGKIITKTFMNTKKMDRKLFMKLKKVFSFYACKHECKYDLLTECNLIVSWVTSDTKIKSFLNDNWAVYSYNWC